MDEPISEAVRKILDFMRSEHGDAVIPAGMASLVFCGVEDVKVGDLSDHELLQLAIVQYRQMTRELAATVELLAAMQPASPRGNRFSRRHR